MASTKPIKAMYSPKLDSMAAHIRGFLTNGNLSAVELLRTHKGIVDFCYKNSPGFKKEFLIRTGVQKLTAYRRHASKKVLEDFVSRLSQFNGECVFLLKDTLNLANSYQQKTGKGFGMLVNRNFLCRSEEDYFTLIDSFYKVLSQSKNIKEFSEKYFVQFKQLLQNDRHFIDRAKQLFAYIIAHMSERKIIFVDLGFQFTFSLFCSAVIRYFSHGKVGADFYSFSTYSWLQKFFTGKHFSEKSEVVLELELEAIKDYQSALSDKAAGSMIGFAIGDALGFPVAGIDRSDISIFVDRRVTSFLENKKHPFFHHLQEGQYTENTNLLMVTARHLVENQGFVVESYQKDLANWGKGIFRDPEAERWAGPTALKAVKNLIDGKSYLESGSTTTASCSAAYRVIPLGIFYRPFAKDGIEKLKNISEISAMITHNSEISKTGAVITALIIGDLMHDVIPEKAVLAALAVVGESSKYKLLVDKVKQAVDFSKDRDVEFARRTFGTGSLMDQTLPLAIFCFLKFQNDFGKAVVAAANSYRDDTPEEKERLRKYSWEEQLLYANGGNTDGVAGLTGAFVGAHVGFLSVPRKFRNVENLNLLKDIALNLIKDESLGQ